MPAGPITDEIFRAHLREGTAQFSPETFDEAVWDTFASQLHYFQGDLDVPGDFSRLDEFVKDLKIGLRQPSLLSGHGS